MPWSSVDERRRRGFFKAEAVNEVDARVLRLLDLDT